MASARGGQKESVAPSIKRYDANLPTMICANRLAPAVVFSIGCAGLPAATHRCCDPCAAATSEISPSHSPTGARSLVEKTTCTSSETKVCGIFLRPVRGYPEVWTQSPTACAVGYYLTPFGLMLAFLLANVSPSLVACRA